MPTCLSSRPLDIINGGMGHGGMGAWELVLAGSNRAPLILDNDSHYRRQQLKQTMAKYILWGQYCEDALEKRTPYREAHLQGLKTQKEQGILVALGPTVDNAHVFGIYEAESEAQVRSLIEQDPYWQNGIWTAYDVHAWNQVF